MSKSIDEQLKALDEQDALANDAKKRRGLKRQQLLQEKKIADLEAENAVLSARNERARAWLKANEMSRTIDGRVVTKSAMDWYQLDHREQTQNEAESAQG